MSIFDFYFNNSLCGNMLVERKGLFVNVSIQLPAVTNEILRAYISDGESILQVGVLFPTDNVLKVNKSFSVRECTQILKNFNKLIFGFAAESKELEIKFEKLTQYINSHNKPIFSKYVPPYMRANQPLSLKFHNRSGNIFLWSVCKNPGKYIDFLNKKTKIGYCTLIHHNKNSTVIAAPLDSRLNFIFAPAFSICTPIIIGGSYYAALQILSNKSLTYLNNNSCIGKNNYENILRSEQNARINDERTSGT